MKSEGSRARPHVNGTFFRKVAGAPRGSPQKSKGVIEYEGPNVLLTYVEGAGSGVNAVQGAP